MNVGTRELFQNKRSKPVFPAALLSMSPNRTAADKTKENLLAEPKPQVRSIFGNRPANKRKNMFADFIVSESEDEIPEIQPKVFGFQKKLEQRRVSSVSKGREHSPTSSITTDIEMDDWNMLPSSTMVDNQLEEMVAGHTPVKRARLSKLSEAKESELGTNTIQSNLTADKTKQLNKSVSSKNKSKTSPSKELETSRTTRSMTKNTSVNEEINTSTKSSKATVNKSKNKTAIKDKLDVSNAKKAQKLNRSKTRNSSKIVENDVITDEMDAPNVINNATRVINKSTSKKLSNSQVSNKSVKQLRKEDDNGEIITDIQNVSNEEDDENNITLEYEGDEMEEVVIQKQQMTNKENVDQIINKSNKNTTKTDINKSKSRVVNESNETLKQEQKASKVIEESVDSQQSMQDNVDGNLEQDNEQNGNRESTGEVNVRETEGVNEDLSSNDNQENDQEGDDSHYDDDQVENDEEENEEEENESQEIEDENNVSNESDQEIDNDANESHEVEADESQVVEEENDQEDEDKANESQEQEVEEDKSHVEEHQESDEGEQDANESQEVDESQVVEEENESNDEANQTVEAVESEEEVENEKAAVSEEEAEESAEEAAESEEEPVESEEEAAESEEEPEEAEASAVEAGESAAEEADESIQADNNESEVEEENQSREVNESQEMDADDNEAESDTNDQQVDGDESEEAASDPEMAEDSDQQEMEVDENDQASNEAIAASEQNESEPLEENTGQSTEEIEESPNVTHDTTGRHRHKQVKSPEAILHDKTNQMDSFTVRGRNTSVRKTKSMIKNLDIRPSLAPRDSIGSEGTRNSSAEGSGWDSHRTTRKTLRQTFGKDFTPRKSLRAMVMEKSAKRQTELLDTHSVTAKFPQANSTEFAEDSNRDVADFEVSDHEISKRTRQTTLELYLQKMKQQNIEKKIKMVSLAKLLETGFILFLNKFFLKLLTRLHI